jgi:hypothetical protein
MVLRKIFFNAILILITIFKITIYANPVLIKGRTINPSSDPISYVNIIVKGTTIGTVSDGNGYFSLSIESTDSLMILFSFIGYTPKELLVRPANQDLNLGNVILMQEAISFSPLQIIGESNLRKLESLETSLRLITANDIPSIPSIAGGDVFRVIQTMEGVNSTSELSNQLYIRGGTPDQNLVLLNGAPIYQPFHLFGLSSSVNEAAVDYIKYYSGCYPAEYGDYMSSVLDISTKPGTDSLSANVAINLLEFDGTLMGSLGNKWRWRASYRRSYYDKLGELFDIIIPYYFYDAEGKISYLPNSKTLISISVFSSEDEYLTKSQEVKYNRYYKSHPDSTIAFADSNKYYFVKENDIIWSNSLASFRFLKKISDRKLFDLIGYYSGLNQRLKYQKRYIPHVDASLLTRSIVSETNEDYGLKDGLTYATANFSDVGLKLKYDWTISDRTNIIAGGGFSSRFLDYRWDMANFYAIDPYINVFMDYPPDTMRYRKNINTLYSFLETQMDVRENISLRVGLRPTWYSYSSVFRLDPRINLNFRMRPQTALRIGFGEYSQALSSSQEYGFYSIAGIYFPSPKIPFSRHYFLNIYHAVGNILEIDATGYRKEFMNLFFVTQNSEFSSGYGISSGFDLSSTINLTSNLASKFLYSFAVTRKTVDNEIFYPNYDQRHRIVSQVIYNFPKNYQVNVIWNFSTGRPANLYDSKAYTGDTGSDPYFLLETPKNSFWYPSYHRLDVGFEKKWFFNRGQLSLTLNILNLYNRKNVIYYQDLDVEIEYPIDPSEPGIYYFKVKPFNGIPFLPVIGVNYEY